MASEPDPLVLVGEGVEIEALWWRPSRAIGPSPAVVLIHPHGDDAHAMSPMSVSLRDAGYHALAVSMRGFGASGGRDDCGLLQPDDQVAVVRWLRDQGGIDAARIGLWGRSQGGQVALLAAARAPSLVRAVVAWNPVTDIDHWRRFTQHPGITGYIDTCCVPDTRARSAVDVASSITAAVMLVHGAVDTRVPTAQSTMMADQLRAARATVELVLLDGLGHRFGPVGNAPGACAHRQVLRRPRVTVAEWRRVRLVVALPWAGPGAPR